MNSPVIDPGDPVLGVYSERIDALFSKWNVPGSPGAIVAVSRRGELIHQRGYGVANIEDGIPFDSNTVLRLGSTTKHMCATCILVLENQGKLSLDDDIRRFVPEMRDYGVVITLRHLLTMTSGLWDGINLQLFSGLDTRTPSTRDQFLRLYPSQQTLMFPPGDDCTYSNSNYSLLSLVVERISGLSIAEFMSRYLFEPLNMSRTALVPCMTTITAHKARGYVPAADGGFELGCMMIEMDGAGGVDSSISDMLKWLANYREDRHFGPNYRQRMEQEVRLNNGRLLDYRLGLNVQNYRGLEVVRHAGGMPGYLCDFVYFPQADLGMVLLANLMDVELLQLPDRIADMVLEDEFKLPLESTFVDAGRPGIAELTGVYASESEDLVLELLNQGGQLVCYWLGGINPLEEADGWLESRKNLFAVRALKTSAAGKYEIEVRLGCQQPCRLSPVNDPRRNPLPLPVNAESLAGRYVHEGFQEIHEVSYSEGKLRVDIASPLRDLVWGELTPVAGDLFVALIAGEPSCTNVTVKFLRDERNQVTALSYSLNRCRHVVFTRCQS